MGLSRKRIIVVLEILALVAAVVTMGSFGQIFMKKGLTDLGGLKVTEVLSKRLVTVLSEWHIMVGIVLYAVSAVIWLTVLSRVNVSFAYPLISLAYVFTAILARFYFNENITVLRWLGILLIIGGVFLVTRS